MKSNDKTPPKDQPVDNPASELDQLRQIVFGDAQAKLIAELATLRSDMNIAIETQAETFSNELSTFKAKTEQQLLAIEKHIQHVDKTHDENEAQLTTDIARLASEHEMFASATQQDFKQAEQALHDESSTLSNELNERITQLQNHLEDVSKELKSSKTDRKTLARLLATMATNLEDEAL